MSAILDTSPRWPAALGTTCVWALAAASVIFWGLRLAAPPESAAPPALVSPPVAVDPAEVAKAFGATTAPTALTPEAGNRFVLLGVIADDDQRGAALIAVDGKSPRPFRIGQQVGDGYVLQSVDVRAARLGAGPDTPTLLTIQLPKPAAASGVMTASQRAAAGGSAPFAPVTAPR